MKDLAACAIAIFLSSSAGAQATWPADDKSVSWPSDMLAAVQGIWVDNDSLRTIEIVGNEIILRTRSQRKSWDKFAEVGGRIATLGERAPERDGPNSRFFHSVDTLWDNNGNSTQSTTFTYVNQVPSTDTDPSRPLLVFNGTQFIRERDQTAWTKEHRAREVSQ